MALREGMEAPDFALPPGPRKEPVRLSDFRGEKPVVLLFFPLAFSSVCTDEMCSVAADYQRYEELDAQVLAVSIDSPFASQKFAQECGATFPILSDFNKEVIDLYDVRNDDYGGLEGVADRSA